ATPSTSAATTNAPSASSSRAGAIARTTAWRWKVQQEKERRAREEGKDIKEHRKASQFKCRHCGQPKTKEYGHSRHAGQAFCSRADGRTVEQWLEEKRAERRAAPPPPPE